MFELFIQTGLRLSELIGIHRCGIVLTSGAHVRCHGEGRKERCTPLTKQTVAVMKNWLKEWNGTDDDVVFPNVHGIQLNPDGVQYIHTRTDSSARIQPKDFFLEISLDLNYFLTIRSISE